MNIKLFAFTLLVSTAIGIAVFPMIKPAVAFTAPNDPATNIHTNMNVLQPVPEIEVVFVLDTTSSMSGLIQAAKEKIWSIASTMASANQNPNVKMGLVAFRDRGDDYVTRVYDLSDDLDSMYAELMAFRAEGGGDGPESVNQALLEAVNSISWSQSSKDVYKVAFLVGDAPPHMDYQDEKQFPQILEMAQQNGIVVNTIQSGQNNHTTQYWQQIASLGEGDFFQVENNGNAIAIETPFDKKLAEISNALESTRLFYGDAEIQFEQKRKNATSNKLKSDLSTAALARRAEYNSTKSGKANLLGKNELVDAITSGSVDLDDIREEEMPASLQAMAPAKRKQEIKDLAEKREHLMTELRKLSQSRSQYIEAELAGSESPDESLDKKIFEAVKAQASDAGLTYESDAIKY